jgi:hypothetical protein
MGKELVSFLTSADPGAEEAWNGAAVSERIQKLWPTYFAICAKVTGAAA